MLDREEQDALDQAQKSLLKRRKDLGLTNNGEATLAAPGVRGGAAGTVGRALVDATVRFAGAGSCGKCGGAVAHPGICAACARALDAKALGEAISAAIAREIPEAFRWARWGAPELVERVAGGAAKVAAARRALDSGAPVVVLLGPGRQGKTSLAAAWLRGELEAGRLGTRWVASRDLANDEAPEQGGALPFARALSAKRLLLDDVGAELAAAPKESGLLAQRAEATIKMVCERHDRGLPLVITTAIGAKLPVSDDARPLRRAMAAVYGDNVAGRLYEHAAVVRVGGGARAAEQAAELSAAVAGIKTFRTRAGGAL